MPSRASAVSSQDDPSANGRSITSTRWNGHYLVPKKHTGPGQDDATPIDAFTAATPDWVFVTGQGPTVINARDIRSSAATLMPFMTREACWM